KITIQSSNAHLGDDLRRLYNYIQPGQVHNDLLDLAGISACSTQVVRQTSVQLDVLPDQRAQQPLHVTDNRVQVHDFEFKKLLAAEREQLTSEGGRALGCLLDGRDFRVHGIVTTCVLEENFGITADHHQKIVEIMSHTAGESSHGLHFLRLTELIFQHAAFGDIFGNHFKNLLSNIGAGDGSTTQPDRDGIDVLALPADLDVLQPCATAKFIYQT